jgi:hypothetical protein
MPDQRQNCLYIRHLELIRHRIVTSRRLPDAHAMARISSVSTWLILKRSRVGEFGVLPVFS